MKIGFYGLKREALIAIGVLATGAVLLFAPPAKQVFAEPLRVGVFPNLHCALIYLHVELEISPA